MTVKSWVLIIVGSISTLFVAMALICCCSGAFVVGVYIYQGYQVGQHNKKFLEENNLTHPDSGSQTVPAPKVP